jgi:hypothetical protein
VDVVDGTQCIDGLGGTDIDGECDVYNGLCRPKCSGYEGDEYSCAGEDRGEFCYLLEGTGKIQSECVNKVCMCINYYLCVLIIYMCYYFVCLI